MKRIYGVRVCLQFARGTWGCQRMIREVFFVCENEVVALAAQTEKRTS